MGKLRSKLFCSLGLLTMLTVPLSKNFNSGQNNEVTKQIKYEDDKKSSKIIVDPPIGGGDSGELETNSGKSYYIQMDEYGKDIVNMKYFIYEHGGFLSSRYDDLILPINKDNYYTLVMVFSNESIKQVVPKVSFELKLTTLSSPNTETDKLSYYIEETNKSIFESIKSFYSRNLSFVPGEMNFFRREFSNRMSISITFKIDAKYYLKYFNFSFKGYEGSSSPVLESFGLYKAKSHANSCTIFPNFSPGFVGFTDPFKDHTLKEDIYFYERRPLNLQTLYFSLKNKYFPNNVDTTFVESNITERSGYDVGEYYLKYKNASTKKVTTLNIYVIDNQKPTITMDKDGVVPCTNKDLLQSIKNLFSVSDNFGVEDVLFTFDKSESNEEHFQIGRHKITVKVIDINGLFTEENFIYIIKDVIAPVIDGPDEVRVYNNQFLDQNTLLRMYTFSDNHKVNSYYVESSDYYKTDGSTINEEGYDTVIVCYDEEGNATRKTIKIKVYEFKNPDFYIKTGSLLISQNDEINDSKLIKMMKDIDLLKKDTNYVGIVKLQGTPVTSHMEIGSYTVVYKCSVNTNTFDLVRLNYTVVGGETNNEDVPETPKKKKDNPFVAFFKKLWNNIKSFFVNLFRIK